MKRAAHATTGGLLLATVADVPCTRFSQPVFVTLTVTNCSEYSHRTCRALWQGSRSRCSVSQLVPFWMPPRHATPRRTSQQHLLACKPADHELQTVIARNRSACPRSLITTDGPTQLQDQIVCFSSVLSLCLAPLPYLIFDLFHGCSTILSRLARQLKATR
jgi:hypothetical protein